MKNRPKIIVMLGPTATGKSDLAVKIAKKMNGEIISADSRQVYTGLNIGTGKITKREMKGVPHHLLDVVSPKKTFSVSEWKKLAEKSISDIVSRGKTPIIVGGTGFYIQSVVDDVVLPEVPPNKVLRKKLENKSAKELVKILSRFDKERLKKIDQKNPVRLIRAIEIATALGSVPKIIKKKNKYQFVQIGLTATPEILQKRIHARLLARLKQGMIAEAKKLHADGLSYKRMRNLGLEYGALADFLDKGARANTYTLGNPKVQKISEAQMIERLDKEIYQYTKRQMTWFKRDKRIKWFDIGQKLSMRRISSLLRSFAPAEY